MIREIHNASWLAGVLYSAILIRDNHVPWVGNTNLIFCFKVNRFWTFQDKPRRTNACIFLKTIHFHQVVRHRRRNIAHAGWPITDMVASWARTHSWIGPLRQSLFKTASFGQERSVGCPGLMISLGRMFFLQYIIVINRQRKWTSTSALLK